MDNNHISSNNASISHSIKEIGDRMTMLNVADHRTVDATQSPSVLNTSSRSLPSNYIDISASNSSSRSMLNIGSSSNTVASPQTFSKLNPTAQEFVPRFNRTNFSTIPSTSGQFRPNNNTKPIQTVPPNHNYSNGLTSIQQQQAPSVNLHDNESYMEDYMSMSYLKDFITRISNKPVMYDHGIHDLTLIINSYLDEDDCVLELIVNQIVDQSIIDGNFLYNGVRLCYHFMENLRETSNGQSFKQLLFKRNQRECSRKVTDNTSPNTFVHLRGLALFTAELYSRCNAPDLAEHLPSLLMNILSSRIKRDENVKCVCDVLKLCGQQMENYFSLKGRSDFAKIVEKLENILDSDISNQTKDSVNRILISVKNNWVQPRSTIASNLINPYLNDSSNCEIPYEQALNQSDLYDFGDCGDENNSEVCQDFEKFLNITHQN
ncbi:Polyadenylate-binding protein-interacting protein 1 [Sarcoptes scabiei]|uniref:Polyadenylate-binding protein-interacting protein 1 n=1 Tax=Sarcoptes scabiei TaxID=52283 RepID=A0A834VID6_SARSC|nr:Polyadenylate-binding protein-interacting protein 1 [Sarcoptes scabiei]